MRHIVLDNHSEYQCQKDKDQIWWDKVYKGVCLKRHCIIWKCGEFVLLSYHECIGNLYVGEFDFVLNLIQNSKIEQSIYNNFDSFKSYKIQDDIDLLKKKQLLDTDTCNEFNYLYQNSASRYAICTTVPKSLMIRNASNIREEYTKAVDYLKEAGFKNDSHLFSELNRLAQLNDCVWLTEDKQIHRTIDSFIKEINKIN